MKNSRLIMDSSFLLSLIMVMLTVFSGISAYQKKCIPYCGKDTPNGIDCPSNYTCTNWDGCGLSCLRGTGYQPPHCPMMKCMATDCPLGFKRDEKGCEGCSCANLDVMRIIECPMVNCMAINCPLGFKRDEQGCEGCTCANMSTIKIIEENYSGSAPPRLSAFASICTALFFTVYRCLY